MASHKICLTHHPSSQAFVSRFPLLYVFVFLGYGWVGYFTFLSVFLKLMYYAHHVFLCEQHGTAKECVIIPMP